MDEDKVQQLIDRQEIIDRMHWYTGWVDLNRVDKQVEVFADDGRLTFYGDDHWIEGKDNIHKLSFPLSQSTQQLITTSVISSLRSTLRKQRAQSHTFRHGTGPLMMETTIRCTPNIMTNGSKYSAYGSSANEG